MLQQTRIEQGLSYYLKFSEAFPTVYDLADADETTVLKMWQGLGYYSRARNLHFTAKYIADELKGQFPATYKELIQLKGVGDYTASAIASICFNEPAAVVDGNVYRVLARYYGIHTPINTTKGIKEFKALAQELICDEDPGTYNQAIMEFGSLQCKPQNPNCGECLLKESCVSLEKDLVKVLPKKEKKLKIKHRYFNFLVFVTESNTTCLNQRRGKGIWEGLYEFPLIETKNSVGLEELMELEAFQKQVPDNSSIKLFNTQEIVHKLSHQHLHTKFWVVSLAEYPLATISRNEITNYPVPILIANFIAEHLSVQKV